jgi:hypothetical protein
MSHKHYAILLSFVLSFLFASIALSEETETSVMKGKKFLQNQYVKDAEKSEKTTPRLDEPTNNNNFKNNPIRDIDRYDSNSLAIEVLMETHRSLAEDMKDSRDNKAALQDAKMKRAREKANHLEKKHSNEKSQAWTSVGKKSSGQAAEAKVGPAGKGTVSKKSLRNRFNTPIRERFKREKPRKPERRRGKR